MKDLSQKCIIDKSSDNLNTIIEILIDQQKYKVSVCDDCSDDANIGEIKKLIPKRIEELEQLKNEMLSKLDEFKLLAAELGFDLVKKGDNQSQSQSQSQTQQTIQSAPALDDKPVVKIGDAVFKEQKNVRPKDPKKAYSSGMTDEEVAAAIEAAKRNSQVLEGAPSPTPEQAPTFNRLDIPEKVEIKTHDGSKEVGKPEKGAQTLQVVKGAAGVPVAIPKDIFGSDGKTTISIVNTGGDRTIQNRGRQLAQMREVGDETFYSRDCRACRGAGIIVNRRGEQKQCISCNGVGTII